MSDLFIPIGMKRSVLEESLEYLACPYDKSTLMLDVPRLDEVFEGEFSCRVCNKKYDILDGVVYFSKNGIIPDAICLPPGDRLEIIREMMTEAADEAGKLDERGSAERMQSAARDRYDLEDYRGTWKVPENMLDKIEVRKSGLVLEGACGPGECLVDLRRRIPCDFYIGIDISENMVKKAQGNALRANSDGRANMLFVKGDIRYLPIASILASLYVVNNAWDRVAEPRKAAQESRRVLAEKGSVVFSNCQPMQFEYERNGKRIVYVPEDERLELEDAVRIAGCEPVIAREGDVWSIKTLYDGQEMLPMKVVYGLRR